MALYDGGIFSTDVEWRGSPYVTCTTNNSRVVDLSVNGIAVIVDGFSGVTSKTEYAGFERAVAQLNAKMDDWRRELDRQLDTIEQTYQRPVADYSALRGENQARLDPIVVRILGDQEDFLTFFFNGDVTEALSAQITLKEQEITNLNAEVAALRRDAEAAQSETDAIRSQLELWQTPIDAIIAEIHQSIAELDFEKAAALYESVVESPRLSSDIRQSIEEDLVRRVGPLPSSKISENLAGYRLLSALSPENPIYGEKVTQYERAEAQEADRQRDDEIASWIYLSDDLTRYRSQMVAATRHLINTGKCTQSEIQDFGGWMKSQFQKGQYFYDCGDERYWINPASGYLPMKRLPVSETRAQDLCERAIRQTGANDIRFNIFQQSYTVAANTRNVIIVQGFSVRNALGNREEFRAQCTISPDEEVGIYVEPH